MEGHVWFRRQQLPGHTNPRYPTRPKDIHLENLADFFTKPLKPQRFFELRDKIMNVKEHSSQSDGKRVSFTET